MIDFCWFDHESFLLRTGLVDSSPCRRDGHRDLLTICICILAAPGFFLLGSQACIDSFLLTARPWHRLTPIILLHRLGVAHEPFHLFIVDLFSDLLEVHFILLCGGLGRQDDILTVTTLLILGEKTALLATLLGLIAWSDRVNPSGTLGLAQVCGRSRD